MQSKNSWPVIDRVLRTNQTLPKRRVAFVTLHQLRENLLTDPTANQHIVERGDDIEHGTRFELPGNPLRLYADVVRGGPGVDNRVVPQPTVVRAAVTEVHQRPHTIGEPRLGHPEACRDCVGQRTLRATLNAPGESPERPGFDGRPDGQFAEEIGRASCRERVF